jgi:hypothetical protein
MAGLDPAISSRALEEITGSSPVMTWNWKALRIFLLDNIPRCVYILSICSVKEAVVRKPHLFMLNVEQLPSVPRP